MDADQTVLIYSSPNGDDWFLCQASGRTFVKHKANPSSGGHETDTAIDDFLSRGPRNPEHEALLRALDNGAVAAPKGTRRPRLSTSRRMPGKPMARDEETLRAQILVLQEDLSAAIENLNDAWQALRRLREEVEIRSGGAISPERTGPTFTEEAEQIARGVIAIYERARAAEARLKDAGE
jgi:hypothetical protein